MKESNAILNIHFNENTWKPPILDEASLVLEAKNAPIASQSDEYFYIFQVTPYIDSLYIHFGFDENVIETRRYTFHEGYFWDCESELFFHNRCIKMNLCAYSGGIIDEIYSIYSAEYPEWHLKRYYTKRLRLLDHIYNCICQNTVEEILYKAGLDELAANVDEMDEINLLARKPSEIYDGLPNKVLRAINCKEGATLVSDRKNRELLKDLDIKFQDTFAKQLNDAQCRYIAYLIKGDATVGEIGRLFRSRRSELAIIWAPSQIDFYIALERKQDEIRELSEKIAEIDTIYANFVKRNKKSLDTSAVNELAFYLLNNREEYDKKIRRSNRKRVYDWQERDGEYVIRYPQTINDFCRESIYMQNCLLTYVEAFVENDTTILFLRRAEDVNVPFITIEVYENDLMQAYHRYNRDCTPEEAEWIKAYCAKHGIGTESFAFDANVDELF